MNIYSIVGLENRSLDWFMNASLQWIFWVEEFMEFFINKKYLDNLLHRGKSYYGERNSSKAMKLAGFRFCDAMFFICSKVASSDQTWINASNLRLMIKNEFTKSEQHDANEFILYLFGKLQDEQTPKYAKFNSQLYKSGIDAWNGYSVQHLSIIDKLFTGMSQTNIQCKSWGNVSVTYDWFNHIHLSWSYENLESAYNEYLSDEVLKREEAYKCEKWKKNVSWKITKEMVKIPNYVIFLFKRFDFIRNRKISKRIDYPSKITLTDMFDPDGNDYNLVGIVIHTGGLSGGHYTAIGYKDGSWVHFNDSRTKKIKKKSALDKDAYILFYKKK